MFLLLMFAWLVFVKSSGNWLAGGKRSNRSIWPCLLFSGPAGGVGGGKKEVNAACRVLSLQECSWNGTECSKSCLMGNRKTTTVTSQRSMALYNCNNNSNKCTHDNSLTSCSSSAISELDWNVLPFLYYWYWNSQITGESEYFYRDFKRSMGQHRDLFNRN